MSRHISAWTAKDGDELGTFIRRWSRERHKESCSNPQLWTHFGGDYEPFQSIYLSMFCDGVYDWLGNGMTVLDYGCGMGKFFNFLSRRYSDFRYYGLEPKGSQWSEDAIRCAKDNFGHDQRAVFGHLGFKEEELARRNATVAFLISIFTHMDEKKILETCLRLRRIARRGGVVFSMHHLDTDETLLEGPLFYGYSDIYKITYIRRAFVREMAEELGVKIEECGRVSLAEINVTHVLYRMTAN
jgi:SAM-dependent methyltransferase